MADSPAERKKTDFDYWRNQAWAEARAREAAQRRKSLLEALAKFVHASGGWVTSVPGAKSVRIEILKDSVLPTKLTQLGYVPRQVGVNSRITSTGFVPVDVIEITLG